MKQSKPIRIRPSIALAHAIQASQLNCSMKNLVRASATVATALILSACAGGETEQSSSSQAVASSENTVSSSIEVSSVSESSISESSVSESSVSEIASSEAASSEIMVISSSSVVSGIASSSAANSSVVSSSVISSSSLAGESSSVAPSSSSVAVVSSSSVAASDAVNLLTSSGTFTNGAEDFIFNASTAPSFNSGKIIFTVTESDVAGDPWDVQLRHDVNLVKDTQYTICFDASAALLRNIDVNVDNGSAGGYASIVASAIGAEAASITTLIAETETSYSETFYATETTAARLTFNLAAERLGVVFDNVGLFEGAACGQFDAPDEASSSSDSSAGTSSSVAAPVLAEVKIEKIGCKDPDDYSGQAEVLFDGSGPFSGAFFNKTFTAPAFSNLSRAGNSSDYTLGSGTTTDQPSCGDRLIHEGTWLKKLSDADEQHSNGFAKTYNGNFAGNRTIDDIDSVVLELRINSDLTDVPSKQELIDKYSATVGLDGIDLLDNGKVNFAITLGDPDANSPEVRGEVFLEIDQDLYRDEWVRITIPKAAFFFWQGANWEKTPVSLSQAYAASPSRIALNPETKGNGSAATHGFTVRNIFGYGDWPPAVEPPEDFKEMNISIRTFEIRFEPTTGVVVSSSSSSESSSSSVASSVSSSAVGDAVSSASGDINFSENFDSLPAGNLPSGLEFIACESSDASYQINGGALEITSGNPACGGWVKLGMLGSAPKAHVKFDVSGIQNTSGKTWFVLLGNDALTNLNDEALRLSPFASNRLLTWNSPSVNDTLSPDPFGPPAEGTTKVNDTGATCIEIAYDNDDSVISVWKDGSLIEGLQLGTVPNQYQQRWFNDYGGVFVPNVTEVHIGIGGSAGLTASFDNLVVSDSPIGCN